MAKLIWEELGITVFEYVEAFHAAQRIIAGDPNIETMDPKVIKRICNIETS